MFVLLLISIVIANLLTISTAKQQIILNADDDVISNEQFEPNREISQLRRSKSTLIDPSQLLETANKWKYNRPRLIQALLTTGIDRTHEQQLLPIATSAGRTLRLTKVKRQPFQCLVNVVACWK
jgi:cell division protein FtsL